MTNQFMFFLVRWALNSFGLWVAARLLTGYGAEFPVNEVFTTFLLAGLVLSLVNVVLKPIIIILSLPAILLTLGLFTLVVNGLMVYIATKIVPGLEMTFLASILAGMIVGLINYVLTNLLETRDGVKS